MGIYRENPHRDRDPSNECCQCGATGAVYSKAAPDISRELSAPIPITWRCIACKRTVCINCVLTVPGSVPVEICEDTLCSQTCQDTMRARARLLGVTVTGETTPP